MPNLILEICMEDCEMCLGCCHIALRAFAYTIASRGYVNHGQLSRIHIAFVGPGSLTTLIDDLESVSWQGG